MATPSQALESLNNALTELENILDPLFEQSLHETMETHEKLQQAKICAMLPYTVNQLITIYLRTRGIDPTSHHVTGEIDRINSYFHKLSKVEDGDSSNLDRASDQRLQLDKEAANRFITAALAEASRVEKEELARLGISGPTVSSNENWVPRQREPHEQPPQMEGGIHTRFARIYDENDDSSAHEPLEQDMLEVIGDEPPPQHQDRNPQIDQRKRKRSEFDPYSGYDKKSSGKAEYARNQKGPLIRSKETFDYSKNKQGNGTSKNARKKTRKRSDVLDISQS